MTARRALLGVAGLTLIGLLASKFVPWVFSDAPIAPPAPASAGSEISNPRSQIPLAPSESRSPLADALNPPSGDIRADLRIVSEVIEAFRTNFPRDGNPVGDNTEITATLTGKNKLRLALIPPDHPAVNRSGELCDRWGTPFFFHAESAQRMEVRSAGPDKKMWSADDVVFTP